MNTNNFKILVEALEALPDEIKNNKVDMMSTAQPQCGTPGCFAGLISIVANDISKLEKCYHFYEYDFEMWENALNNFLECSFVEWAKDNPNIWNNKFGFHIFIKNKAWGKKENETLTHNDIIIHLRKALNKWIAFENKSNEHQYPTEQ
jgi:hypothetical protein